MDIYLVCGLFRDWLGYRRLTCFLGALLQVNEEETSQRCAPRQSVAKLLCCGHANRQVLVGRKPAEMQSIGIEVMKTVFGAVVQRWRGDPLTCTCEQAPTPTDTTRRDVLHSNVPRRTVHGDVIPAPSLPCLMSLPLDRLR